MTSWAWPGVTFEADAEPFGVRAGMDFGREATARTAKSISESPFSAVGVVVRPDNGGIDHLRRVVREFALCEGGQRQVPDAGFRTASVLSKDRVAQAPQGDG